MRRMTTAIEKDIYVEQLRDWNGGILNRSLSAWNVTSSIVHDLVCLDTDNVSLAPTIPDHVVTLVMTQTTC